MIRKMEPQQMWRHEDEDLVQLSLKGSCRGSSNLKFIEKERIVYNGEASLDKVIVISGGGSGHEPTHTSLVGDGMLDIAIAGDIFSSPSSKQIVSAIGKFKSSRGYLLVVKNYTGDIIHFGLAMERAKSLNKNVEMVIVGDDVSVGRTKNGLVGRRGLAGVALVHKVAGALSVKNYSLSEMKMLVQNVANNIVTIGASLNHCKIPGAFDTDVSYLCVDEMEIGMGIHNEPGVEKISPLPTMNNLITKMLAYLLSPNDKERYYVPFDVGHDVVLLVNNLGGISEFELNIITEKTSVLLSNIYGIEPTRTCTGTFTSSLNGNGFSISLLNISRAGGSVILESLDSHTGVSAWRSSQRLSSKDPSRSFENNCLAEVDRTIVDSPIVRCNANTVEKALRSGLNKLLDAEPQITDYDTIFGDGDCGTTLKSGAQAVIASLDKGELDMTDGVQLLTQISLLIEDSMGGTSGGLYSIYVSALAHSLRNKATLSCGELEVSTKVVSRSMKEALDSLFKYTMARRGDRTLIDVLDPFVKVFSDTLNLGESVKASTRGLESTKQLRAKFGRATYINDDISTNYEKIGGLPDPGALGLNILIQGFVTSIIDDRCE